MRRRVMWRSVAVMAAATVAFAGPARADNLDADADALATSAPRGNEVVANQAEGTTVEYDLSAMVDESGNSTDNVFPGTVNVSITRSGAWLAAAAGSPASFSFTSYDTNQAGKIRITVPACTEPGTTETMTAVLAAGTSTNGKSLSPNSVTLSYVITAGAGSSVCTATNTPPVVETAAADANGTEGDTLATSGAFSDADDDALTITKVSGAGTVTDNADGTWSWSLATTDDASGTVEVQADDGSGGTVTDSFDFSAVNGDPVVGALAFTQHSTGCGVDLSASFTDPGSGDTHASSIDWGDDSTDDATDPDPSPVTGSHVYAGPGTYTVTVSVTDDDGGSHSNTGSPVFKNLAGLVRPPINSDGTSVFKGGSTIPVKIVITDCAGAVVSSLTPTVSLVKLDSVPDGQVNEQAINEVPTNGKAMRWDADGQQYIYNLSTKNSAFTYNNGALTAGTYRLTVSDTSLLAPRSVNFSLK